MKRTLFTLMLMASSAYVFADGTFSAKNLGGFAVTDFATPYYPGEFQPLPKSLGRVEILDGTTVLAAGNFVKDGFFALGTIYDPTPGTTATLTIRAWDVSVGSTYAAAVATRFGYGSVVLVGVPLATGTTPPSDLTAAGFRGIVISRDICPDCPEPGVWAMGVIGIGGLVVVGRRR